MNTKKKIGIFSLTCDEGCSITLTEIFNTKLLEWLEKMEIFYFLSIKDDRPLEDMDIAVVEGTVGTEYDKKKIEQIRENSEVLIAMGSCAITALPSGQRNNFNEEQEEQISRKLKQFHFLPECLPLKDIVKVDDEINGCPINEQVFIETFEKYLN